MSEVPQRDTFQRRVTICVGLAAALVPLLFLGYWQLQARSGPAAPARDFHGDAAQVRKKATELDQLFAKLNSDERQAVDVTADAETKLLLSRLFVLKRATHADRAALEPALAFLDDFQPQSQDTEANSEAAWETLRAQYALETLVYAGTTWGVPPDLRARATSAGLRGARDLDDVLRLRAAQVLMALALDGDLPPAAAAEIDRLRQNEWIEFMIKRDWAAMVASRANQAAPPAP